MTPNAKRGTLTIFEGPDGSGKTTAAIEYAKLTGAAYFHHGPYKEVGDGLSRMVFDTMLPALLGYQDVVLDRCWLSEPIYGAAFRKGEDRVGTARRRIMERTALSLGGVLVNCRPPWRYVAESFISRSEEEYLDNTTQLQQVYEAYGDLTTDLSEVVFDWTARRNETRGIVLNQLRNDVNSLRKGTHLTRYLTTGAHDPKVILVGEEFGPHKNVDSHFQLPFSSLSGLGCSLWLADQLEAAKISEQSLGWVNVDQLPYDGDRADVVAVDAKVIALGENAWSSLKKHGIEATLAPHPQYWKRFKNNQTYPLIDELKEILYATP